MHLQALLRGIRQKAGSSVLALVQRVYGFCNHWRDTDRMGRGDHRAIAIVFGQVINGLTHAQTVVTGPYRRGRIPHPKRLTAEVDT